MVKVEKTEEWERKTIRGRERQMDEGRGKNRGREREMNGGSETKRRRENNRTEEILIKHHLCTIKCVCTYMFVCVCVCLCVCVCVFVCVYIHACEPSNPAPPQAIPPLA